MLPVLCVILAYRLSWQLSQHKKIAFASGFIIALTPDLILNANYVWSDLMNVFLGLLYTTLLISAIRQKTCISFLHLMLAGMFATLFRLENILLLGFGFFFLLINLIIRLNKPPWHFRKNSPEQKTIYKQILILLSLFILSVLPIFGWFFYKNNISEYDGVRNYAGEVFYTGWVYYGEASNINITDLQSPAVQKINTTLEHYPAEATDKKGVHTGWQIYPSLIKMGYLPEEAMNILSQAAIDSMLKDFPTTIKVIERKVDDALTPGMSFRPTFPLPEEGEYTGFYSTEYFNPERFSVPLFIRIQRSVNTFLKFFYSNIYHFIVYLMVIALFFLLYRRKGCSVLKDTVLCYSLSKKLKRRIQNVRQFFVSNRGSSSSPRSPI